MIYRHRQSDTAAATRSNFLCSYSRHRLVWNLESLAYFRKVPNIVLSGRNCRHEEEEVNLKNKQSYYY